MLNFKCRWEGEAEYCPVCTISTASEVEVSTDNEVLICDGCGGECHSLCVGLEMQKISEVDWHCPGCAWEIQEKEEAMGEE